MYRAIFLAIVFVIIPTSVFAQAVKPTAEQKNAEKQERQAAIVSQLTSDADGLGLAENRSFVYARLGAMLWKRDQKQASAFFQKSIDDLVTAQSQAESEARNRPNRSGYEYRINQAIRPTILMTIATSDAKFALESLYRTRTGAIQRALTQAADPTPKIADVGGIGIAQVRNELNLEQRITRLAAEQDPATAVKLLVDSLKRGISSETLSLLKKLFEKDAEAANGLASEVLDKLMSSDFSNNPGDMDTVNLATTILNDYIRDKKPDVKEIKFNDMQIRSLAGKLISFTLSQDSRYGTQRFAAVVNIAQKLQPGSVAALKKLQKSSLFPGMMAVDPDVRKIIDSRASPAQMVTEARSLAPDERAPVYQAAATRMAQTGDINGATGLLNQYFTGAALDNALNAMNIAYANYLIGQTKYTEAEHFIDDLAYEPRRMMLLGLATAAFKKNPTDNKSFSVGVLRKVRTMMPDRPSDNSELVQFMQLAGAYAPIDADESFNCLEPLAPQLNELADASAMVQGFQNNGSVRLGEFVIGMGWQFGFQIDTGTLRTLAKTDLERAQKLIDLFTRREIRAAFRLQLAETGLN